MTADEAMKEKIFYSGMIADKAEKRKANCILCQV